MWSIYSLVKVSLDKVEGLNGLQASREREERERVERESRERERVGSAE